MNKETNNAIELNDKAEKIIRYTIADTLSTELEEVLSNKIFIKVFPLIVKYASSTAREVRAALLVNAEVSRLRDSGAYSPKEDKEDENEEDNDSQLKQCIAEMQEDIEREINNLQDN